MQLLPMIISCNQPSQVPQPTCSLPKASEAGNLTTASQASLVDPTIFGIPTIAICRQGELIQVSVNIENRKCDHLPVVFFSRSGRFSISDLSQRALPSQ